MPEPGTSHLVGLGGLGLATSACPSQALLIKLVLLIHAGVAGCCSIEDGQSPFRNLAQMEEHELVQEMTDLVCLRVTRF